MSTPEKTGEALHPNKTHRRRAPDPAGAHQDTPSTMRGTQDPPDAGEAVRQPDPLQQLCGGRVGSRCANLPQPTRNGDAECEGKWGDEQCRLNRRGSGNHGPDHEASRPCDVFTAGQQGVAADKQSAKGSDVSSNTWQTGAASTRHGPDHIAGRLDELTPCTKLQDHLKSLLQSIRGPDESQAGGIHLSKSTGAGQTGAGSADQV